MIGLDKDFGVQKFHSSPTSRLGGVGIFTGLTVGLVSYFYFFTSQSPVWFYILISSIPVFLGGLLEDLTHRVPALARLLLAVFSAIGFIFLMGFGVERTDVPPVDWLLQWQVMAFLITILVLAGFTHAVNIIDGFNGLASGQILLMLGSLSYLNYQFAQVDLLMYSLLLLSITLSFFCWNWPFGKIFLGDSGSYFLGFNVVTIGITMVHRIHQLSPFAPILIGLYPLVETLFSIYRRVIVKSVSMNRPDALHLHSLIYQRVVRKKPTMGSLHPNLLNSRVTFYFFMPALLFDLFGVIFSTQTNRLLVFFFLYIFTYLWLFTSIVRFKTRRFQGNPPFLQRR